MKLTDFDALTFDVYGTLIDWETGIGRALRPLTDRLAAELSRDQILEAHAHHESTQQRYTPSRPYREILATVYRRLAESWHLNVSWDECRQYGRSVGHWPAFPDSVEALGYLKKHYRLFVLSNVDGANFSESSKRLQVEFDGVFTAEDIGSYKPSLRNFKYMLEQLDHRGITKERVLHTAESMFHDHAPANQVGIASCHIFRRHRQKGFGATVCPETMPHFDFRFNSMVEMVASHRSSAR